MYANFAGRDASRGMAKQSFDEGQNHGHVHTPYISIHANNASLDMLTSVDEPLDKLDDLTQEEMYVVQWPRPASYTVLINGFTTCQRQHEG